MRHQPGDVLQPKEVPRDKWRSKFGGMDASLMSQLNDLQDENRRHKKMCADAQLSAELLKEAMAKKW
jgi:putative transposase